MAFRSAHRRNEEWPAQSDDLKEKLEVLLGAKPDAPVEAPASPTSTAGAALFEAALGYLGELASGGDAAKKVALTNELRARLDPKVVTEGGASRLSIALPSPDAMATLARGVVNLLLSP